MTQDIFNGNTSQNETTNEQNSGTGDQSSTLEQLVGEGKKFKDLEALAAAKLESDAFIEQLKRENKEMRNEVEKIVTLEQRLEQLAAKTDIEGNQSQNHDSGEGETDIQALVKAELATLKSQEAEDSNLDMAINTVISAAGDAQKATKLIAEKAEELGVTPEVLKNQAKQSPKLFLASMGLTGESTHGGQEKGSSGQIVESLAGGGSHNNIGAGGVDPSLSPENYAYFRALKKKDPSAYFKVDVQNAIQAMVKKHGVEWLDRT